MNFNQGVFTSSLAIRYALDEQSVVIFPDPKHHTISGIAGVASWFPCIISLYYEIYTIWIPKETIFETVHDKIRNHRKSSTS